MIADTLNKLDKKCEIILQGDFNINLNQLNDINKIINLYRIYRVPTVNDDSGVTWIKMLELNNSLNKNVIHASGIIDHLYVSKNIKMDKLKISKLSTSIDGPWSNNDNNNNGSDHA